jgi:nucleoside-diphosphate-sugar epimerase
LADDHFSPTFMRNATAYGVSPRLRLDIVLNDFVASAFTTGSVLIKSDATPWRPITHIRDIIAGVLASARRCARCRSQPDLQRRANR